MFDAVERSDSALSGLFWELRPWQWYKQGIVFLGIVFSGRLFDLAAGVRVVATVIAFTMVAGAVYVLNDVRDREADRNHPRKRHRPVASGQVSVPVALVFGVVLGVLGLALGTAVHPLVGLTIGAYVGNNVLYTFLLKDVLFVDVLSIAIGFVFRALAGVYAVETALRVPSAWLIVCTLLAALMLGFGKRYQELKVEVDGEFRASLDEYHPVVIERLLVVVTATVLVAYSLYTFFGTDEIMMITLPFAFFATFRFHHLLHVIEEGESVERLLLLDRPFLGNLVCWVGAIFLTLYVPTLLTAATDLGIV